MDYKKINNKYIVRLDKDEEVIETLKQFCREQQINLGKLTGLGAINKVIIGTYKTETKKFYSSELIGDYEITSLIGNISKMDGDVYLHAHVNISDVDHKIYGGHLISATISATAEIFIEKIEGRVEKEYDADLGLVFYNFNT